MNGSSYFQLLNPLILLIFSGGFAAIYLHDRKLRAAFWMALAYGAGCVGFLLDFFVRDAVGAYAGTFVSNVPLLSAVLLISVAVHARFGDGLPWRSVAVVFVATFAVTGTIAYFDPLSFHRALAMNFGSGLAYALAIPPLWSRWRTERGSGLQTVLLVLFVLSVAQSFIRPVVVASVVGVNEQAVTYSDSLYALTLHLVSAINALSLAAVLMFGLGMDLVRGLNRRASEDPLTGLLNRRGLEDAFDDTMCKLSRCDLPLSVVVGDIDRFKRINDRFGHAAGDAVIVTVAGLLAGGARSADHVSRMGGEEFAMLLWNTDLTGARTFAEGCRVGVSCARIDGLPEGEGCTASFGVAQWRSGEGLAELIARADAALYEAKNGGRDRVCIAPTCPTIVPDEAEAA